jgi:hypothetical protein
MAAEGRIDVLAGTLELDGRDRRRDTREGWLVRATIERPVGGSLTRPANVADHHGSDHRAAGSWICRPWRSATISPRRWWTSGDTTGWDTAPSSTRGSWPEGVWRDPACRPSSSTRWVGTGTLPGFADVPCRLRRPQPRGPRRGALLPRVRVRPVRPGAGGVPGHLSLDFGFGHHDYDDRDWWDGGTTSTSARGGWSSSTPGVAGDTAIRRSRPTRTRARS